MSIYNFGVGSIYGRRTGVDQNNVAITVPSPVQFGAVQEVDVEFERTLKELVGQYQFPVDIAVSAGKITGKLKSAGINGNLANDIFFGQTLTQAAGELVASNEQHNGAATVTVTQSATYLKDLGVIYVATGIPLMRVAPASEATGKYSVNESTGIYTFGGTDVSGTPALFFSYSYSVTSMVEITINNLLMGIGPTFEIHTQMNYPNNAGVVNQLNLKLYACRSSKFGFPFKNVDYTMPEIDFQAFANAAGVIGTLSFTQ